MYWGHLNRKNNMPRKNPLLTDYAARIGSEPMFTNTKAKRSRRAFKINEPRWQFNKDVAMAVMVMIVVGLVILLINN